tara:strand:- start:1571 stop:2158 length:588 start_codon:yes stop_codon:yes gene_type:complete
MSSSEEKIVETEYDNDELPLSDVDDLVTDEKKPLAESSEFALKMINSVKEMNSGQLSHYEMVNAFSLSDELKCLFMFIQALPHRPIVPMYPEAPFLFFKGVLLPRSFDLTEEMANDVETFMKGKNSEYFNELHLHDLEPYYLDAYESAVRIYNDMVEKTRSTYIANVKQAKSQVMEISAALICGLVVILALVGLS